MSLDEVLRIVKDRHGLLDPHVAAKGKMTYALKAQRELRAIPAVKFPECGAALFPSEVVDPALGTITIEALLRKNNPELLGG